MQVNFTNSFLFLIYLCFLSSCQSKTPADIPVANFFNKTDNRNFQLSPNGKYVSFLQQHEGIQNLFVIDLDNGKTDRITSETDIGIRYSFWANDDELIFLKDRNQDDSLRLMVVNRKSLSSRFVLPPDVVKLRWVGPLKVNEKNELLVGLNSRDSSVFDVYRVNIIDCTVEMAALNPGNIIEWLPDNQGEIKVAIASDGHTNTILYRTNEQSAFRSVIKSNFRTSVEPLGFSSEKRDHLFALSNQGRDKKALVELNMLSGKESNVLFSHDEVDLSKGGYSNTRGAMDFTMYHGWKPEYVFFNPIIEKMYAKINELLPGYTVDIEGNDVLYSRFLLHAYTDVDPGAYYYYNNVEHTLQSLGKVNSSLDVEVLSPSKAVHYTTSDGMEINAYLTLPKQGGTSNLPVVVIPHNGPSSRVVWGYNAEVQFLASRGYVVFQPNYRGSTGYGKNFWTSGFKQWGTKVQEDIHEGVEWLIREGIADPKRIAIYGFNFGGYSALYGACFNSELYACAASYSGITNLYTYLKEIPPYYTPYMKKFYEIVGNPETDGDYLRAYSPVFHADKVSIPLFIAQGVKDNRSNVNETNHFVKELRKNGVDVTYMVKDDGNHFSNEKNKVDFYEALAAFLGKHLQHP